jgi:hypothetical protein
MRAPEAAQVTKEQQVLARIERFRSRQAKLQLDCWVLLLSTWPARVDWSPSSLALQRQRLLQPCTPTR